MASPGVFRCTHIELTFGDPLVLLDLLISVNPVLDTAFDQVNHTHLTVAPLIWTKQENATTKALKSCHYLGPECFHSLSICVPFFRLLLTWQIIEDDLVRLHHIYAFRSANQRDLVYVGCIWVFKPEGHRVGTLGVNLLLDLLGVHTEVHFVLTRVNWTLIFILLICEYITSEGRPVTHLKVLRTVFDLRDLHRLDNLLRDLLKYLLLHQFAHLARGT